MIKKRVKDYNKKSHVFGIEKLNDFGLFYTQTLNKFKHTQI